MSKKKEKKEKEISMFSKNKFQKKGVNLVITSGLFFSEKNNSRLLSFRIRTCK